MWKYTGKERPPFAESPRSGQESVWDFPRPPRIEVSGRVVEVKNGSQLIASTMRAKRLLETASPPTYYIPEDDVLFETLVPGPGSSFCEWKGTASYWYLRDSESSTPVAWSYPRPNQDFRLLKDHVAFYPGLLECYVDREHVRPQPGRFYGGWVTNNLAGPFKGGPGTGDW